MPCYRCEVVQTDPVKGASPWQRGVIADTQILVCPLCQQTSEWRADLDRCRACGGNRLVRRLGETICADCQHNGSGVVAAEPRGVPAERAPADRSLAEQVETALQRVLHQPPG